MPDAVFQRRHRGLLLLLWMHAVGLFAFGVLRGYPLLHSGLDASLIAAFALAGTVAGHRKRVAAAMVSFGLITSSAVLVHLWGGVIEAHFHFFVMVVLLSLYEDWVPFSLAAAYVVMHHGLMGVIDPSSVYNHAAGVQHPWRWAAIHGLFVTAAGVGSVIAWRLNEDMRAQTRRAYEQARDSEERFKSAFENAPIGMALATMADGDIGRYLQVNRAMSAMTGYSREQLLGLSAAEITHPDDVEIGLETSRQMLAGEISAATFEKRYLHADGQVVSALVNLSLVRDGSGEPLHGIIQIQDITERKRAERQLTHQAFHDPLTGMPNRRKLMTDLQARLAAATPPAPTLLVVFDLDGFKAYNDTYGHPAGDALLVRLGQRLSAAVRGRGIAYRMGGDEFCVLATLLVDGPEALANAGATALTQRGEGFEISASYGTAEIPVEAVEASEALRIADQRMYARKGRKRTSAGRQATDTLLRALAERNPTLGTHLDDVTDLCEAVGHKLELPDEQMTPLLQAAALHDVGKVAIPDAILNKPAPLDEAEWEFMRSHPLIGERILSEAASLAEAAKIVRSSHERVDGHGYPDGLTGDEIPLAARIIAVCDAFDAMTSNRPYRTAMSVEGALSELSRRSGRQFDPAIVWAFEAVIREPHQARTRT